MFHRLLRDINLVIALTLLLFTVCSAPSGPPFEYYAENRIAFSSDMNGNLDLYTIKTDGSALVRLTDCEKEGYDIASRPCWSPVGNYIAFMMSITGSSDQSGTTLFPELYYITPKGSHLKSLLSGFPIISFCWSLNPEEISVLNSVQTPWGNVLIVSTLNIDDRDVTPSFKLKDTFKSTDSRASMNWSINGEPVFTWLKHIYYMETASDTTSIELAEGLFPKWSPEGGKIAYVLDEQIWIMNGDGSEKQLLIEEGDYPDWSPDGEYIVFQHQSEGKYNLSNYDFRSGRITTIIDNGYNNIKPVFSPLY
jgi:Tol biopolymer transport system component